MSTVPKLFIFFFWAVLVINFITIEARPFNTKKWENEAKKGILANFFGGFSLESIKQSGPSPCKRQKFTDSRTLGGIKAGPSPGDGHKFTNAKTLGGVKNGPSPGDGHKFTNAKTLGGIKNSVASTGAGHNKSTNTDILGGIKDAGPSAGGGGHSYVTGNHQ